MARFAHHEFVVWGCITALTEPTVKTDPFIDRDIENSSMVFGTTLEIQHTPLPNVLFLGKPRTYYK